MAKLPSVRRIAREDLRDKEIPKWVDQLLRLINNFFENVYSALDRNITFNENIRTQEKSFTITAGATATDNQYSFLLDLPIAPSGVWVIKALETDNPTTPVTSAVFVWWRRESNNLYIESIAGLTNGTKYTITILIK